MHIARSGLSQAAATAVPTVLALASPRALAVWPHPTVNIGGGTR